MNGELVDQNDEICFSKIVGCQHPCAKLGGWLGVIFSGPGPHAPTTPYVGMRLQMIWAQNQQSGGTFNPGGGKNRGGGAVQPCTSFWATSPTLSRRIAPSLPVKAVVAEGPEAQLEDEADDPKLVEDPPPAAATC